MKTVGYKAQESLQALSACKYWYLFDFLIDIATL